MTTVKSNAPKVTEAVEATLDDFDASTVEAIKNLLIANGLVFKGAGPVIRNLESKWTQAFLNQNRQSYNECEVQYNALKTLVGGIRQSICSKYDMATSGYVNSEWLDGVERLVQKSDTPRGRKPAVRQDPADLI